MQPDPRPLRMDRALLCAVLCFPIVALLLVSALVVMPS